MRNKIVYSLLVSIGLLFFLPLSAQKDKLTKKKLAVQAKLKRVIDSYYSLNWFNGIVLISDDQDLLYRNATGYANWDYDVPNSLSTSYNIGMTTQVFTATAIMQLVAKGDIKLKGFLKDYMPKIAQKLPYPITIHQLLNHTSGLDNYYESKEYLANFLKIDKIEDLIEVIVAQPKKNMPGYDLFPSPSNYVILAGLIEKVSGMSYEDYIVENIITPSSMKNTKLSAWNERIINKATAYVGRIEKRPVVAANIWGAYPFGSEGLYCNIEDLWRFTQAFFNGKLLPEKYQNMMLRNYEYIDNYHEIGGKMKEHANGYSYGWRTKQYMNYKIIYHNSFLPGTNIEARTYDDFQDQYTIILLSNLSTDKTFSLANELDKVICEKDYTAPTSRIAMLVQNEINYKGIDYLVTYFDSLLQSSHLTMDRSWQLNNLAWTYKEKEELDVAQHLFELNAKYFPDDVLIYDGLGQVYLEQKNYEKAQAAFERCLHYTISTNKRQSIERTIDNIKLKKRKHQENKANQQLTSLIKGDSEKKRQGEGKTKASPPSPAKTISSVEEDFLTPMVDDAATKNGSQDRLKASTSSIDIDQELLLSATAPKPRKRRKATKNTPSQFPGGSLELEQYLIENLKLSSEAFATADKKTVYIGFIVKKSGKIKNVKVTKGLTEAPFYYKKEAIRLVENMPRWTPAYHKGKAVSSYQLLPIEFEKLFEQVK